MDLAVEEVREMRQRSHRDAHAFALGWAKGALITIERCSELPSDVRREVEQALAVIHAAEHGEDAR